MLSLYIYIFITLDEIQNMFVTVKLSKIQDIPFSQNTTRRVFCYFYIM